MSGELSASVSVGGARLRYCVQGRGMPALVVGSAIYYPRTFSRGLRDSLRLAFADTRHFAEPETPYDPDDVSLATYASDIDAVRASVGFERAVVIGHSHHGNLAVEYARRFPERVSHLVLIGSPPCDVKCTLEAAQAYWEHHACEARKAVMRERLQALDAEALERLTPEQAYVARYVAEAPRYWYDPHYDAAHLWWSVPICLDRVTRFRALFADGYTVSLDSGDLTAPVLVAMGRHDYAVAHTLWNGLRLTHDKLSFRLFERSGHTPQLEEPDRFDRVLLEWLGDPS